MATHIAKIRWIKTSDFSHEGFDRRHDIAFQDAVSLPAVVPGMTLVPTRSSCWPRLWPAVICRLFWF